MAARSELRFALNHIVAPRLDLTGFCRLASRLAVTEIEIRNDLPGRAVADGTAPEAVAAAAARERLTIVSINALQRFDDWNPAREREARELARFASRAGARALVLVPTNDGSARPNGEPATRARRALAGLGPILSDHGLVGLVEPLGFETSSLRSKRVAVEAIETAGEPTFRLVHDTFHHALAGEPELFPALTGLVHISGVNDRRVSTGEMQDRHRLLVDRDDRLDTVGQIAALRGAGYDGPFSFEPFADEIHAHADPHAAIAASIDYIRSRLAIRPL